MFLREAVQYLGVEAVKQDLRDIISQRGRTPDEELNVLMLAEYDAATAKGPVDMPEFSKGFYRTHCRSQSAKAVEKRLRRLLRERDRAAERQRKFLAALRRPSLLGTE